MYASLTTSAAVRPPIGFSAIRNEGRFALHDTPDGGPDGGVHESGFWDPAARPDSKICGRRPRA